MLLIEIKKNDMFVDGSLRMVNFSKSVGVDVKVGKLKSSPGGDYIQSFIFDGSKFTNETADKWVKDHENKSIDDLNFLYKDHSEDIDADKKVVKYYRAKISNINEAEHTVKAVVNDETIDRDNEINTIDSWSKRIGNYKAHPVLLSSHDYRTLQSQIGEAKSVTIDRKNKQLVMDFKYYVGEGNKEADWAWTLASKGVAMFSVGYMPHARFIGDGMPKEYREMDPQPRCVYTDNELLEVSQVVVGSNRGALQMGIENPTVEQNQYLFDVVKSFGKDIPDFEVIETEPVKPFGLDKQVNISEPTTPPLDKIEPIKQEPKIKSDSIIISPVDIKDMKELQQIVEIIKSGRVLSEKNLTVVKTTIDKLTEAMTALKALIELTEPKQEEDSNKTLQAQKDEFFRSLRK